MDITKAEQIALDDALVAPANLLKIGKCNLRLSSDLTLKEATLQVVYDVLKLTPFYKAFQASADVLEIYMQEEMLQICPIIRNQKFDEPPFEQEILAFLVSLGHSGEIRKITDVNVNKLHQPWRSFAAVIKKHEDTQLYGAIFPMEFTNEDIRNFESYKEYYAIASGEVPPKTKASVHKKKADSDTTPKEKPPTDPKDKRVKQTDSYQEKSNSNTQLTSKVAQVMELTRSCQSSLEKRRRFLGPNRIYVSELIKNDYANKDSYAHDDDEDATESDE
ncbi:hypothetical protein Tco_0673462 [Tanacetum coccineum]